MRTFLLRLLLFLVFSVALFSLIAHFLLREKNMLSKRLIWYYVYERVLRSREKIGSDTLYLGDSVGNQFIPFEKNPNALMTNAGVLMTGQYVLAREAIRKNPEIRCLKMVMVPNSIGWNFERPTSFNNFCKPFLSFQNLPYFSPLVFEKINQNPLNYLIIFDFAKMLTFFQLDLNDSAKVDDYRLSDISIEYLLKLVELCHASGIKLEFVSPPVPQSRLAASVNWNVMRGQIADLGLSSLFEKYFAQIQYLPDSYFRDDIHLTPDYLNAHGAEISKGLRQ